MGKRVVSRLAGSCCRRNGERLKTTEEAEKFEMQDTEANG